jgi:isochorismate synthase
MAMTSESYYADLAPHPLSVAQTALAAGRFPVVLWHAPGDRTLVAAGRALSRRCAPATWREELSVHCAGLLAEASAFDAVGTTQLLFSLYFDPEQAADRQWQDFPEVDIFIPEFLYAFQKPKPSFTFHGDEKALEEARALAKRSVSNQRHVVKNSGSHEIEWKDKTYTTAVRSGLQLINSGRVDKIVLAREIEVRSSGDIDPIVFMDRLVTLHPDCFLYLHAVSQDKYFISSSPERLARVENGMFRTNAVAGTLSRGSGAEEDAAQERALLASEKNRNEHAFVLDMLKDTASGFCSEVLAGETRVLALHNVHHLVTPVSGSLSEGKSFADAVAALHPTPAVCGAPRAAAMADIRSIEDFRRGLYAGCAGWIDAQGNGEAAVTIRSALVHGRNARIFAGAGIVRDSDPDGEALETRMKAEALIEALR